MSAIATTDAMDLIGKLLVELTTPTALALRQLSIAETIGSETVLVVPDLGIEATLDANGVTKRVHMHGEGHEGFRQFPLFLRGISFRSSMESISEVLGAHVREGNGAHGPWREYLLGGLAVHFLFSSESRSLVMVTTWASAGSETSDDRST